MVRFQPARVAFVVFLALLLFGCSWWPWGAALETAAEPAVSQSSSARSVVPGAIGVEALTIGSTQLLAFSYDFGAGHWVTPVAASGATDLMENAESAILNDNGLTFARGEGSRVRLEEQNLPDQIDILHFSNLWHTVLVDGVLYGDHERGRDDPVEPRTNAFQTPDGLVEFDDFYVVFVNRAIIDRVIFWSTAGGATTLSDEEDAALLQIQSEVWPNGTTNLFIPMDPILDLGNGTIRVTVSLDDAIVEITDTHVIWNTDGTTAPVDYAVTVPK